MIARPQLPDQRRGHRRHAARGRAGCLGAFERAHARFEHGHRRVTVARIDVARLFVLEPAFGTDGAVIDIALGEIKRLRILAKGRAQNSGMHEMGLGTVTLGSGRGHFGPPLANKKTGRKKLSAGSTRPRPFSNLFYVAASRPAQMTTG